MAFGLFFAAHWVFAFCLFALQPSKNSQRLAPWCMLWSSFLCVLLWLLFSVPSQNQYRIPILAIKKHEGFGILRVFLVILLLNKREKIFSAGPLTNFGKPAILSSIKGSSRRFLALIDCDNLDGRWPSASFRNWQDFYCGKGHNGSLFLLP